MRTIAGFIIALLAWSGGVYGQKTPVSRPDTVRVGASTLTADTLVRAVDTTRLNEKQTARLRAIKPRTATIRSAILPGLGQAYNRQYWKIPIIYGGFATIGYFVNYMNGRTKFYRENWSKAYYSPTRSVRIEINGIERDVPASTLERAYSTFRRYRDLNILLGVLLWTLNVVDANVTAHLRTFDLSDDLSLRVQPTLTPASPLAPATAVAPGVRLAFTFR